LDRPEDLAITGKRQLAEIDRVVKTAEDESMHVDILVNMRIPTW